MKPNTSRQGRETESAEGAIFGAGEYAVLAKMRWSTPVEVVAKIAERMAIPGFDLDATAEDTTAHAPRWYTAERDCLSHDWSKGGWAGPEEGPVRNVFTNPPWGGAGTTDVMRKAGALQGRARVAPFPGTERFVRYAIEQSRSGGLTVAILMPLALDTNWQRDVGRLADEIWLGGRVKFFDTDGVQQTSPPGGHLLMIFRPWVPLAGWPGGPRVDLTWSWT